MITAKAEEKTLTLNIHTEVSNWGYYYAEGEENAISDVTSLKAVLDANKDVNIIDIYINSPGGDVMEGIGIYNILKRSRAYKRVYIDGFACSIASVIAMAGNSIQMPKSSLQMIHNAWTCACGNSKELRKVADDLETINEVVIDAYMTKFKGSREELMNLLDNETYLTAEQCLEYGLCTKVIEDTENTEENTNESLDALTNVYANKLNQLESIKAAIRSVQNAETAEPEEANEAHAEASAEGNAVNEADDMKSPTANREEVDVNEVKDEVHEVQMNALQKFFNVKPTTTEKKGE